MIQIRNLVYDTTVLDVLERLKSQHPKYFSKGFRTVNENIIAQCPFHKEGQERNPSGGFRTEDGFFHCFGCGESRPFYKVIEQIIRDDSIKWMNNYYSSEKREVSFIPKKEVKKKEREKIDLFSTEEKNYVPEEELNKYARFHPYMKERKLTLEVIKKYKVGFDAETNSITFPVRDSKGNILFIARRNVNSKFFNYPKDVEKPLYGYFELLEEIKKGKEVKEIFITESIIDCLNLVGAGYDAVALNGVGSRHQIELIKKLPFRKVILALDNDEAGEKGKKNIKQKVNNKIFYEVKIPDGKKDINDLTEEEIKNLNIQLFL